MAINVFTNVPSLNAQRNLNTSAMSMSKALQRLSSGMRINSASDDAAGLAISNGLTAQVRGLSQAIRNAGDGLSMLGTAEGALVEQTSILQRLRELAVQSSSDTNNSTNRADLNSEASQLKAELERIARTTSFNGNSLLDGTFQSKDLQVGSMSTANDRMSVSFASTKAADIGAAFTITGTAVTASALIGGDVNIVVNGQTNAVGASTSDGVSTVGGTYSALAKANAINAITSATGVTADASTTSAANADAQTAGTLADGDLTINGVSLGAVIIGSASDGAIVSAINAKFAQTGVTAALDATNKLVLTAADGRNITTVSAATGHTVAGFEVGTVTNRGTITLRSGSAFQVTGNTEGSIGASADQIAAQSTTENVNAIDLTTKGLSQTAIKIIDVALGQLNSRRATIGAMTNRLNTTISNLSTTVENASASNARIMDADFAQETAAMSRSQILQQAGVAILSQANQAPQLALSLLR